MGAKLIVASYLIIGLFCLVKCQGQRLLATSSRVLPANNQLNNSTLIKIDEMLMTCSKVKRLEECDLCAVCQNGAFCRQSVKKRTDLLDGWYERSSNPIEALSLIRGYIDFTCYCVPGYTGTYCQVDINECLSSPCANNATCIDRVNAYECKCPLGFNGIRLMISYENVASFFLVYLIFETF